MVQADDGRRSVSGVVVQRWVDGREPSGDDDWRRVAAAFERVHGTEVTQRPGALVVTELSRTLGVSVR